MVGESQKKPSNIISPSWLSWLEGFILIGMIKIQQKPQKAMGKQHSTGFTHWFGSFFDDPLDDLAVQENSPFLD